MSQEMHSPVKDKNKGAVVSCVFPRTKDALPVIITPREIRQECPLTPQETATIARYRKTVVDILNGVDNRVILLVGPCSIHDTISATEYARRLYTLAREVDTSFFIIMRAYFEKSRTALGWKGLLSDPGLDGSSDILQGIRTARCFLRDLVRIGLPAGLEFLDPLVTNYIEDCVTWGSIGARTTQSQIHRQLASSLAMPIGFKNTTDGNILNAVQAAYVANSPHTFLHTNLDGDLEVRQSTGNVFPHIVLRGGESGPNYDNESLTLTEKLLREAKLPTNFFIDCSHGNSGRDPRKQQRVFCSLIDEILTKPSSIKGLMLESYLCEGNQKLHQNTGSDVSITDPCIDWKTTESLIRYAHTSFQNRNTLSADIRKKTCVY